MKNNSMYENLQFTGMINLIRTDAFPHSFPPHWHKYVEIAALPKSADAVQAPSLRINQTIFRMHPGDILLIWPGEIHETIANAEGRLVGLQFSTAAFNGLTDFAPFFNIFRTFHHIRQAKTPDLAGRMISHIRQMLLIQEREETFAGVETLICLYEMFMDFGTHIKNTILKDAGLPSPKVSRTIEKISMACNYITDNCERELTLESVAERTGFSTWYFSRIFKQITNCNFIEYLTLQRIKRAQFLLSDSNLTVTDISYQSGFKSISTFNRVFRQYRGCSPSEYRKYYLK